MGNFFAAIGTAIYNFITNPVVQAVLFVAQGVTAHQAAMKAKRTGADILLQKYGTGGGIPVIYGTRRVAGTVVYMETQNNRELYVVYAIAAHEIDSFDLESIQLDGRTIKDTNIYRQGYDISDGTTRINFRPSSVTRASGTFWGNTSTERANITGGANINNKARMTFNCHKGTTSQAADPMLEGILTDWTSNHKLTGIAYIAANYEYDTQGMFSGIPNLTIVVNGKKVFDPRDTGQTFGTESTYTHSSNAALCLLDYITNDDYGKGLGTSDLESDFASWKTAADDCDTSVDTIDHTGISVESASTDSDVMIIADASQTKFNKLKVGNKYTVDDGTTTYVNNKKLIDKDSTQIDIDGSNAFAILKLKFEDGAIDNAITSATSCDFAETQIRFDCNGVLDTEETVLENTKLLIANMRGIFTYANGKYQIKVEGAESSVVTLDEDDILESGITLSLENKEAKYNKVEAEFYNAQKRYESDTTYYTGETSDTFLADDGNEVLETRIQLPFCTNQRIAYNHAKGLLKRSRKQKTISFVATPKVLKAKVGEVITVSNTNLNLSSELYRITNMTINPDLNVAVTAIEYQTDVYGYVTPPDEDIDIPDDPPEGNRVVAPTNLTFTNKNATTGEAAKLTWTDSTKYPSYEFRVRIIDGLKTRYDKRVKDTYFYLDGISVKNGYEARVSAINALGVESDSTNITVNVTTEPITTPDIKQGSIGGFSFTDSKMYHPVDGSDTGVFETSNVYIDDAGQFSLKDKLSFDGTTLDISGNLTVENTITADKIVVDGINLDNLISASTQSGSIYLTEFTGIKVATAGATNGYPAVVKLQDDQVTNGFTDILQFSNNLVFRTHGNTTKGAMRFEGRQGTQATPVVYGGFDTDGNFHINYTDVISSARQLQNIASLDSTTTTTIQNAVGSGSTTTINNNADNRVITGSNTADTLNGEANLTFDGSALSVTGTISSGDITIASSTGATLNLTDSGSHTWKIATDNQDNFFRVKDGTSTTYLKVGTADSEFATNLNLTSGHNLTVGGYVSASNIINGLAYQISGTQVISSARNIENIGTYSGTGKLTLTNASNNHLRLAYNSSFYWDIYRESTTGDLIFDSSNTSGEFVRFDAVDKSITVQGAITSGGVTTIQTDGGNEQLVIKRASNTNEQLILGFHSSDYGTIQAVEQGVSYRNLYLQPSGANVGIGGASAAYTLDVNGSFAFRSTGYAYDTDLYAYNSTSGKYLRFGNNTSTGGLLTMTDATNLTIQGQGSGKTTFGGVIELEKNNSTAIASGTAPHGISLSYGTADGYNAGLWFSPSFGDDQGIAGISSQRVSGYQTDLRFYTNNTNSARAFSQRMQIDKDGNLLVGGGTLSNTYGTSTRGLIEIIGTNEALLALKGNTTVHGYIHGTSGSVDVLSTNSVLNLYVAGSSSYRARLQTFGLLLSHDLYPNGSVATRLSHNNPYLRCQTAYGYLDYGPANSSFCHFYTDRSDYYFNTGITVDTGKVQSYNEDLILRRAGSTSHQCTISTTGATFTQNVKAYSDERLKDNIQTLDGSKVFDMRGVSYMRDNKAGSGVIAQEIEKIAPELVHTADDDMGTKSVAYGNLVGYLIEAVKELKAEIEELKK